MIEDRRIKTEEDRMKWMGGRILHDNGFLDAKDLEFIGLCRITISCQPRRLMACYKDHTIKQIRIMPADELYDTLHAVMFEDVPYYDEAKHTRRMRAQKPKYVREIATYSGTTNAKPSGFTRTGLTTTTIPNLVDDSKPRSLSERSGGKSMSRAEVKRLLAEAFGDML
jgi:hypothetical protein